MIYMIDTYDEYKEFIQDIVKNFLQFYNKRTSWELDYPRSIQIEKDTNNYYEYCFNGELNEIQ